MQTQQSPNLPMLLVFRHGSLYRLQKRKKYAIADNT